MSCLFHLLLILLLFTRLLFFLLLLSTAHPGKPTWILRGALSFNGSHWYSPLRSSKSLVSNQLRMVASMVWRSWRSEPGKNPKWTCLKGSNNTENPWLDPFLGCFSEQIMSWCMTSLSKPAISVLILWRSEQLGKTIILMVKNSTESCLTSGWRCSSPGVFWLSFLGSKLVAK